MATIVEMINPLTGLPEQVDQLDHTAQEIDDAVDLAPQLSNPNLLDNWYFANPVNQRGQTSYSVNGYTIDRWYTAHNISYGTLTVDKTAGCVTISHADDGGFVDFIQTLENPATEIVTLSVLMLSGNLYSATGTLGNISLYTDEMYIRSNNPNTVVLRCNAGKTISMIAAKLELGSQQTLAHQDADGNWVLNEIPDYGEQLARCQRYQRPIGGIYPLVQKAGDNTWFWFNIPLPTPLRANPQIDLSTANILSWGSIVSGFSFSIIEINDCSLVIKAMPTGSATDVMVPALYLPNGTIADANL